MPAAYDLQTLIIPTVLSWQDLVWAQAANNYTIAPTILLSLYIVTLAVPTNRLIKAAPL